MMSSAALAGTTRKLRWLALVSYVLLLAWVIIWQSMLTTTYSYSAIFILLLYAGPLLLPAKGMLTANPYTHAWANFITLFYLIHGITVAYAVPAERLYAIIEILLASGMFTGCSMFARFRGRELGLGLKKAKKLP
ncbi:DUF2069 domain-containing protein [Salinimonas sediminis]|uniref:DUF2069 domain-containing protein n=1 Tax=Salinimonas sediminis TaxID=2303538 RepID=UPI0026BF0D2C